MHMKREHNESTEMEPPFNCDYCGHELPDYGALGEHKQLHLNRPAFECVLCEYKGTKTSNLKAHVRFHVSKILILFDAQMIQTFIFHNWRGKYRVEGSQSSAIYAARRSTIPSHW